MKYKLHVNFEISFYRFKFARIFQAYESFIYFYGSSVQFPNTQLVYRLRYTTHSKVKILHRPVSFHKSETF